MDEAKIRGVVHVIDDTKTFGQRGFQKRMVVLEKEDGRFTSYIPLEFVQTNVDLVDQLNIGDEVEITYRLGGRKWQRDDRSEVKYFLSAEATGVKVLSGGGGSGRDSGGGGGRDRDKSARFAPPDTNNEDDPIPF